MSIVKDRAIRIMLIQEGRLIPVTYKGASPQAIQTRKDDALKIKTRNAMSVLKAAMMRDVREHAARVAASAGIYPC